MELELIGAAHAPQLNPTDLVVSPGLTLVAGEDRAAQGALLRLLALRWRPSRGRILVEGRDASTHSPGDRAAFARRVGFAPGDTVLPSHLSVRRALSYLAALWQIQGGVEIEQELDRWDLRPLAGERLGGLSPGEKRRFVLAASLLMRPELWLLEHPFDGLDVPGQVVLRELIVSAALNTRGPRRVVLACQEAFATGLPVETHRMAERGELRPPSE